MKSIKSFIKYFTKTERILWSSSVLLIIISFIFFDRANYLALVNSIFGITSLIFCAKGNPFGQFLMIVFGTLYGIISYSFAYYGEMITYLGMTVPMAFISLVSWLRNPFLDNKSEVKVNRLNLKEVPFLVILASVVTTIFYFALKYLNTENLIPSTLSVTTSFVAVYLTARRSPYYALAYAVNDIVLIVLWILASVQDISYLSVIICFVVFLINDIYGFYNWKRMQKRQSFIAASLKETYASF